MSSKTKQLSFGPIQSSLNDFFKKPHQSNAKRTTQNFLKNEFEIPSSQPTGGKRAAFGKSAGSEEKRRKVLSSKDQNISTQSSTKILGLPTPPDSTRTVKAPAEPHSSSPVPCTPIRCFKNKTFALPVTPRSTRRSLDIIASSQSPHHSAVGREAEVINLNTPSKKIDVCENFFCVLSSQISTSRYEIVPSSQSQTFIPGPPATPSLSRSRVMRTASTASKLLTASSHSREPDWQFNIPSTQDLTTAIPSSQPSSPIMINNLRDKSMSSNECPTVKYLRYGLPSTQEATHLTPSFQQQEPVEACYSSKLSRRFEQVCDSSGISLRQSENERSEKGQSGHSTAVPGGAIVTVSGSVDGFRLPADNTIIPETPTKGSAQSGTASPFADSDEEMFDSSPVEDTMVTSPVSRFFAMLDEPRDFGMNGSSFLNSQFSSHSSISLACDSQLPFSGTQESDSLSS